VTLAFNASSGTASRWYRDCFEAERRDRLHTNLYGLLDEECPKAPTDLLFLPHVAGSGTPYLDSSMGGAALGLKTTTTKSEIYKAVLEGICFEMQWNAELLTE
jgi:xylulokinase